MMIASYDFGGVLDLNSPVPTTPNPIIHVAIPGFVEVSASFGTAGRRNLDLFLATTKFASLVD